MRELKVIGIRHGEVHNPDGVIYAGLKGYGLSDAGRRQADAAAKALERMGVEALYASPLDRAVETAGIIAEACGVGVVTDERLQEWRYWQQWAGMTWEELRTKGREAWEAYRGDPGSVTEGESLQQLSDRVAAWLADVRDRHAGLVVGVTHLEPLRAGLLRLLGRPPADLFSIEVGVAHGVRLDPDPQTRARPPDALGDLV